MIRYWELDTGRPNTLSTREVAEAVGVGANRLEGLLGPVEEAATVTVHLEDWAELPHWSIPDDSALYVVRAGYPTTLDDGLAGDGFPVALANAWRRIEREYEPQTAVRIMARYARRFGYSVREETLTGYSQSDWLGVICVERANEVDTESLKAWCFGDVYGFAIEVDNPVGCDWSETVFGLYGNEALEQAVNESLQRAVTDIRANIRKELAQ